MKRGILLLLVVSLFLTSQSYGQTIYKAKGIKVMKGVVTDLDQDGRFDGFSFMVKNKKKVRVESIQILDLGGELLESSKIHKNGKWTEYFVPMGNISQTEFLVRIQFGSSPVGGFLGSTKYAIPGDGGPGGPGGDPDPTVIIIKYP